MGTDDLRREHPRWWRWLRIGFIAFAVLLIVASFLPLWTTDEWWVRELDYPRLQIFALLIGAAIVLWAFNWRWSKPEILLGAGIAAALAWQASHFVNYLPLWPKTVADAGQCPADRQISLLNANVLQTNDRFGDVLDMVAREDADVVLLLETDPGWADAMKVLDKAYPHRLSDPVPSTYGMMLFSKLPMEGEVLHRMQRLVPSIDARLTLRSGEQVDLKALHPEPPWPGEDTSERDAELVVAGREVRDSGRATIALGDMNDVAWSDTSRLFRKVSGMRDPRVGRGLYPTFHADHIWARWPLDHAFVTPHWTLVGMRRLDHIGSDHFPIRYDFCLSEDAGDRLVAPDARAEIEQSADEQVREGAEQALGER